MFNVDEIVTVTDMTNRNGETFQAKIVHVDIEPLNRGSPTPGPFDYYYYAKLLDISYQEVLLQGWCIYCKIDTSDAKKCVITSISKDKDQLTVEEYDPLKSYIPYQTEYNIKYYEIESILLSQKGFCLKK